MLCVHLVGLVKDNKLITMHGVNNFKILNQSLWLSNFIRLIQIFKDYFQTRSTAPITDTTADSISSLMMNE
jgi:hypothetical protein